MPESRWPGLQRVETADDLSRIVFVDDMAEIEIPIEAIDNVPWQNAERLDSERYRKVLNSIRLRGYDNFDRITARIGRRGRLSIVNGGHRLKAAKQVAKEWWPNMFGRKVKSIQMIVFRTRNSATMVGVPDGAPEPPVTGPTVIRD